MLQEESLSGPAVLVAIAGDRRPEAIARALARAALLPALAFNERELRSFARTVPFAAVVFDGAIDPTGAAVAALAGRRDVVLCFLARERTPVPAHAHAVLPADIAPAELASRLRALLGLRMEATSGVLTWGSLRLDVRRRRATFDGADLGTTPVQFRILAALARARGGVVTKDELQSEAWPWAAPDDGERLVAHIRRIRAKLYPHASGSHFLLTARGEGFRLADVDRSWDGVERRNGERRGLRVDCQDTA